MRSLKNFGRNLAWYAHYRRPRNESEVLEILSHPALRQIRAFGGRHSWSAAAVSEEISVDMAEFKQIEAHETSVRAGAGCTLQQVLDHLHATTERTLPTLGVIKKQTVSGAISTGTHGSGRPSLSSFVAAVQLAAYDANGKAKIFDYQRGPELEAARCAVGCMGLLVSVELATVPKYCVQESVHLDPDLERVLARYQEAPLTQFSWIPYRWDYLTFERRRSPATVSPWQRLVALLLRVHTFVAIDVALHLFVRAFAWFTARVSSRVGGWIFRHLLLPVAPYMFIRGARRIDDAEQVLTQRHDFFRHEEMELFIPESKLREAVVLLRCATEVFAGVADPALPAEIEVKLRATGLYGELLAKKGRYTHHYGFFFRRVLPQDASLIAMTSDAAEPYFSIGVFTYFPAGRREPYYDFCSWLARCMHRLYRARLHWGKHFPLDEADVAPLYPAMNRFRQLCAASDPRGVFRNAYTRRVLGL